MNTFSFEQTNLFGAWYIVLIGLLVVGALAGLAISLTLEWRYAATEGKSADSVVSPAESAVMGLFAGCAIALFLSMALSGSQSQSTMDNAAAEFSQWMDDEHDVYISEATAKRVLFEDEKLLVNVDGEKATVAALGKRSGQIGLSIFANDYANSWKLVRVDAPLNID